MNLRVAAAQMPVTEDVQANLKAVKKAVRFAARKGAEVLLTPECSVSGPSPAFDAEAVKDALAQVRAAAAQAGVGLALGTHFLEPDGKRYNELRFYSSSGKFLGRHNKILLCGALHGPRKGEVKDFATGPLRVFRFGRVVVGGLLCNDLWANPQCTPMPDAHLSQQLSRRGARVILHAVNGARDGGEWSKVCWNYHEANLRMRAAAGRIWIVTVDNCDPVNIPCSAPSGVLAPNGYWAYRAPSTGDHCFAWTIDLG